NSGSSFCFILLQPALKLFERDDRKKAGLHTSVSVVRHLGTLPVLLPLPQVGTRVYLLDRHRKQSDTRTRLKVTSVGTQMWGGQGSEDLKYLFVLGWFHASFRNVGSGH